MHNRRVVIAMVVVVLLAAFCPAQAAPASQLPCSNVQAAIDAAPAGSEVDLPAGTCQVSLTIGKNLTLAGAGRDLTVLQATAGQRVLNIAVATGSIEVTLRGMTIKGGQTAAIGGGIRAQNAAVHVDACIVSDNSAGYGGGLGQEGSTGNVTVTNSRFEDNTASIQGGGIYVGSGNLWLFNTDIANNKATSHGGGVNVWAGSTILEGGTFSGNSAGNGANGGGANVNNSIVISGTLFRNNTAGGDGGGVLQWNSGQTANLVAAQFEGNSSNHQGGGLWAHGNLSIIGSSFAGNQINSTATSNDIGGAGLYAAMGSMRVHYSRFEGNQVNCDTCGWSAGGGILANGTSSASVASSTFSTNKAWGGAGISSTGVLLTVQDSTFDGNSGGYGGGVSADQADIQRSTFIGNSVINSGGAVGASRLDLDRSTFIGNSGGLRGSAGGGALWATGPSAITNTLFADNRDAPNRGAAILFDGPSDRRLSFVTVAVSTTIAGPAILMTNGTLHVKDTIIANHSPGIQLTGGGLYQDYSLYGNCFVPVMASAGTTVQMGAHTLSAPDAGFVDAAKHVYGLKSTSPAVDAGIDVGVHTDLAGDPRPIGKGYDMGMDEAWPPVLLPLVIRQ